jgi:hypothetical protein
MTRRGASLRPRWLTPEGTLDLEEFPIDSVLRQALDADPQRFRAGCTLLASMAASGRTEAGVFLVGVFHHYAGDRSRQEAVVEQLQHVPHPAAATVLLAELRRVKSSNSTRRYLDRVLRSLTSLPRALVAEALGELAADTSFSPRMRAKLRAALAELC